MSNLGFFECAEFRGEPDIWTPARITSALWLDASDAESITLTSGKVSQWSDKSGNARHVLQATDAARPVVTTGGQHGLDVLTFDGGDWLSTSANFPETGNAGFSVFWVHTKTTATSGGLFGWGDAGTSLGACGFLDEQNTYVGTYYAGGHAYKTSTIAAGYNVWAWTKSAGSISATTVLRKNGTGAGTSGHSTSTPNISALPFSVGRWATYTSSKLVGSIAEILVLPTAVADADVKKIEGYFAHKWGLTSSLPADHPYKLLRPVVDNASSYFSAMNLQGRMRESGIHEL